MISARIERQNMKAYFAQDHDWAAVLEDMLEQEQDCSRAGAASSAVPS